MHRLDLVGKTFGKLRVIKYLGSRNGATYFLCKCKCGREKDIRGAYLSENETRSCGCLRVENARKIGKATRTHGMTGTSTYATWQSMKARCNDVNNAAYDSYGRRGITICDRWELFENFLEDMGERPEGMELDRKDNDKGYNPSNCRWVTSKQQMRNRRCTLYVEWNGKKEPLSKLCEEFGIKYQTAYSRLRDGLPIEQVLDKHHYDFFTENNPRKRLITFKGVTKSLADWSRETGIGAATILYRINNGWELEEALTILASKHNKLKSIRNS